MLDTLLLLFLGLCLPLLPNGLLGGSDRLGQASLAASLGGANSDEAADLLLAVNEHGGGDRLDLELLGGLGSLGDLDLDAQEVGAVLEDPLGHRDGPETGLARPRLELEQHEGVSGLLELLVDLRNRGHLPRGGSEAALAGHDADGFDIAGFARNPFSGYFTTLRILSVEILENIFCLLISF